MPWKVFSLCLVWLFLGTLLPATPLPPVPPQPPTSRIIQKPGPVNGVNYPVLPSEVPDAPTEMDLGPVQRKFTLATKPDTAEQSASLGLETHDIPLKNTDKNITFPSIHEVHNDIKSSAGNNSALEFELKYLNWGAVTSAQQAFRRGDYFTITWDNDGPQANFTVLFEYRQVLSKEVIRRLTVQQSNVSGAKRAYFGVIAQAYQTYGPISAWRISILKDDQTVAQTKSIIW